MFVDTVTRGKAILQKAQLTKKTSSVLENAEKWGVKIIPLEAALKYIQKEIAKLPKVTQKNDGAGKTAGGGTKIKRLKQPLLKFESNTNQYKPIYSQLESWPHPNVETPKGTCPFDGTTVGRGERSQEERGDRIGLVHADIDSPGTPTLEGEQNNSANKGEVQSKSKPSDNNGILGGVRIVTAGELRRRKELKRLAEKKRGYCECCMVKYEDLDKHVHEEQHRAYIRDKRNYEALDHMIKTGPNTALFLQRVLMQHCVNKRTEPKTGSSELEDNSSKSADKSNSNTATNSQTPSSQKAKSPRKTKNSIQLSRCLVKVDRQMGLESPKFTASVSKKALKEEMIQQPKSLKVADEDVKQKPESTKKISSSVSKNVVEEQGGSVSPTEKASVVGGRKSSDGLDIMNHVVPKRTKNTYGMYLHMSPSRVSWKKIMKIDNEQRSEETLQEHSVHAEMDTVCQDSVSIERDLAAEEKGIKSPRLSGERGHQTAKRSLMRNMKECSQKAETCKAKRQSPEQKFAMPDDEVVAKVEILSQPRRSLRQTNRTETFKEGSHEEVDGDNIKMSPAVITRANSKSSLAFAESPQRPVSMVTKSIKNLFQKQEKRNVTNENMDDDDGKQKDYNNMKELENNSKSTNVKENVENKINKCLETRSLSPRHRRTSSRLHIGCESANNESLLHNKGEPPGKETVTDCQKVCLSSRQSRVSKQHPAGNSDTNDKNNSRDVGQIINNKCNCDKSVEKDITDKETCQNMSPRKLRVSSKMFCAVENISNIVSKHSVKSVSCQQAAVTEKDLLRPEKQKVRGNLSVVKNSLINENLKTDIEENVNNSNSNNVLVNEKKNIVKIRRKLSPRNLSQSQHSPNGVSDITADKSNVDRNRKTRLSGNQGGSVDFTVVEGSVGNFNKDSTVVTITKNVEAILTVTKSECPDTRSTNMPPEIQTEDIPLLRMSPRKHKEKKSESELRDADVNNSSVTDKRSKVHTNDISISTDVEENRFFVNSMELVKQRSIMRRLQAQSQVCSSSSSTVTSTHSTKPRKYFRKQGTPRRILTSPATSPSTSKITEIKKAKANKLIKISLNCSSKDSRSDARKTDSVLRSKYLKQDQKVVGRSPTKSQTFSRSKEKLVQVERINSDPPHRVLRRRDCVKSYKETSETDFDEDNSYDDEPLSFRSKNIHSRTANSSPMFKKSPRFRKRLITISSRKDKLVSFGCKKQQPARRLLNLQTESVVYDLRKSRENVVTENSDVYNINNELGNTPAKSKKRKKNDVESPKSGYSITPRSSKRKRPWRAKKQESSSQGAEKHKPTQKRLSRLMTESGRNSEKSNNSTLGSSSVDRISKHTNEPHSHSTVIDECAREKSNSRSGHNNCSFEIGKRKSGARVKLDLSDEKDGNCENHSRNVYDDDKFVAIKKLEISDLTILTDDCDCAHFGEVGVHGMGNKSDISATKQVVAGKTQQENKTSVKSLGKKTDSQQNSSITLQWHSVMPVHSSETDMKNSSKTVKLDRSWSLLTDRSVAKILESEGESDSFEGFKPDDLKKESLLGSDISFVEADEVEMNENSEQEWEVEQEDQPESDIIDYVADACTFTSPGKRTDSSWDDPFDNYIDTQLHVNRSDSKSKILSPQKILTSPRRSKSRLGKVNFPEGQNTSSCVGGNFGTPRKRKFSSKNNSSSQGSKDKLQSTPKRKKQSKSLEHDLEIGEVGVQRIDDDIIFNYCSPQKMRGFQSPAKTPECEVVDSSSPFKGGCLTSTPFISCTRQKSQEAGNLNVIEELPALNSPIRSSVVTDGLSSIRSTEIKNRRILKKVSTVKKKFSLPYNKPEKSRSRGRAPNLNKQLIPGVETIIVSPKR